MSIPNVHLGLKGRCQVSVVENGQVVKEYPAISNLILNAGLDSIASFMIQELFDYCAAGTGSTPTELDSGAETITIVAGAVTVSGAGFLAGDASDVGRTIKVDGTGNIYTITAHSSATQCTVTPANSEGPDGFIIYNTNQTGLTAESTGGGGTTKRTNTYLTGAPFCQTVTTGNTTVMTRTFDFAAETGGITYNEVGFSRLSTVGANLFSRVKLPTGVPLVAGQQLRVQYSISVATNANTPVTFGASPITGWPTATGTLQHISIPFMGVTTLGGDLNGLNSVDGFYYAGIEPSRTGTFYISERSTAHPSYGSSFGADSPTTSDSRSTSLSSYVSGSYTRDHLTTFPVGEANNTLWRSFECIYNVSTTNRVGPRFLFDTEQTKISTYTLTLGFRWTWGRVL